MGTSPLSQTGLLLLAVVIALLLLLFTNSNSQELPRRVYLGIRMENLTEDLKNIMNLPDKNGVLVSEVLPASTALKAGFKRGDVLVSLNGAAVNSTAEVLAAMSGSKSGERFTFELVREGKRIKGADLYSAFPTEQYADLDVVYSQSSSPIGLQRAIVTKPRMAKKLPLVVFIGGIGCYSLDFPFDSTRPEVELTTDMSRAGFVCARLEKPGMGDNAKHSKGCAEVSFDEEMNSYVAAINGLKHSSDVDSNNVFIFGHSMGGVFAPLIAQHTTIKGIVAYGTIGSPFIEHLAKTRRTIAQAYEMSPEDTDVLIKDFCECATYYFADKLTTEEAGRKKESCKQLLSLFDLRSRSYNNELYGYNIASLWNPFAGKVLML